MGEGTVGVPIAIPVLGLAPDTTYHYRVVSISSGHTVYGSSTQLRTLPVPEMPVSIGIDFENAPLPTVVTGDATLIDSALELLYGSVNPNGTETVVYFEYGLTPNYGSTTPLHNIGSDSTLHHVQASFDLDGIMAGWLHYRLVAFNAGGMTVGEDKTVCVCGFWPWDNGDDHRLEEFKKSMENEKDNDVLRAYILTLMGRLAQAKKDGRVEDVKLLEDKIKVIKDVLSGRGEAWV